MNEFFFSFNDKEEENNSIFPTLSLKDRLIGFAICFVFGYLLEFMALGSLVGLLLGRSKKFAFLYTTGNIVSIFGTFFLIGPQRQLKYMLDPIRKGASLIFIFSIILTIISIYLFKSKLLVVLCVIIQFGAFIWYVMSYIPYGRDCLRTISQIILGINL